MNNFICEKCNKVFIYKHHLARHQNSKKYPCEQFLTTSSKSSKKSSKSSQISSQILTKSSKSSQISSKSSQISSISSQLLTNSSQISETIQDDLDYYNNKNKEHICTGCDKKFSRIDNLKRHINQFCKGNKKTVILEKNIIDEKSKKNINNIDNIDDINNIDNIDDNDDNDDNDDIDDIDNINNIKVKIEQPDQLVLKDDKNETKITKKYSTELQKYLKTHELDEKTQSVLDILVRQNEKLLSELSLIKYDNSSLKNEIKKLKQNTTINNTLNNQNNIIFAHGKEEFDKIDLEVIMKHLSTVDFKNIIPNMTKHLYLNDSKPQYKNFCVVDISRNKAKFYDGKKWIIGKADIKIDKIFDKVQNVLTEPFEGDQLEKTIQFIKDNPHKFNRKWIDYSKRYLDNLYDEDDKEGVENRRLILNELKHIFFNNKDDILKISLDDCDSNKK